MAENKTEMIPVPLPTEVPPPPSLDNIPLDILHSATVEMLIQQTEDLSSRLKVNIRRNSQLEQRILTQEKEIAELNRKRENVLAQIEIVKEKEKIWTSQKQAQQRQSETLQKESDLLELRYQELYTTTKQKERERQADLAKKQQVITRLEKKLDIMHRVRIRAKEKLRQLLLEMAQGLHKTHKSARQSESSNRLLKRNFSDLKNETIEKENFFREQLQNLKAASEKGLRALDERITDLNEKNKSLIAQKQELQTEFDNLQAQYHDEKKNRIRLKRVSEELSELKNERIRLKREMADQKESMSDQTLAQTEELKQFKSELAELRKQQQDDRENLAEAEKKILSLNRDNTEMADQLASVQKLWIEAQERLEKEELRSQTLEKINRQLSQHSKTERVEKSIEAAHQSETKEKKSTNEIDPFQRKIQNVCASQYRTLAKPSDMDV